MFFETKLQLNSLNKVIWRSIRKQAKSKGEKYAKLYIHSLTDYLKNRQIQQKK